MARFIVPLATVPFAAGSLAAQATKAAVAPAHTEAAQRPRPNPAFLREQLTYSRVRAARDSTEATLRRDFRSRGLAFPPSAVYLRAFKRERVVELWVAETGSPRFELFKVYPICALSGALGPKRQQGDLQVPEGFYHISAFNPVSQFYLSLGVDYPNEADRLRDPDIDRRGGDIFLHGGCQTIGCMPMTNAAIREIYWLVARARAAGQRRIPVSIYPARLDLGGMESLMRAYRANPRLVAFWRQLRAGYMAFERTHTIPAVAVASDGRYLIGSTAGLALAQGWGVAEDARAAPAADAPRSRLAGGHW